MALELAKHNPVYEDIASKFFEVNLPLHSLLPQLTINDSYSTSSSSPMR